MMRKHWRRFGLAAIVAATLTACGDQGDSPLAPRTVNGLLLADTTVATFTVGPSGGRYNLGATHRIEFPANAICDLATSSYGSGTWDQPCTPTTASIRITAKSWTDAGGHPHIDFQPAMRFSPTLSDGVVLYLKDKKSAYDPSAKIMFCSGPLNLSCVDESASDASLAVRFDSPNGFLYRRIKHFSGYNVTAGRAVDVDVTVTSLDSAL